MFQVNQQVIYRPRHQSGFIHAIVRRVTPARVTIEFDVAGVSMLRSVKPDRLKARAGFG